MTSDEAAERLGIRRRTVLEYARHLGLPLVERITRARRNVYDISENDLKAIAAERRRRQYILSERAAELGRGHKGEKYTHIDPEQLRRAREKGVRAAAEMRRRRREWLLRHDSI